MPPHPKTDTRQIKSYHLPGLTSVERKNKKTQLKSLKVKYMETGMVVQLCL